VPRSRQPVHLVTLTPEDLPEIHRSSCDGPVAGRKKSPAFLSRRWASLRLLNG
jgi:hypothetical protein